MANSAQLRKNKKQHKPKNIKSKKDDKLIYDAMLDVKEYLEDRFQNEFANNQFYITHEKQISIGFMKKIILQKKIINHKHFDATHDFDDRNIQPDGGVLLLKSYSNHEICKVLLISEVKRQGTNDQLKLEGKPQQSRGNAVERLGKNLTAVKTMFMHEKITPFVCFGWGCDFDHKDTFVDAKIFILNEFFNLNKIFVFKKYGDSQHNYFSPVSMYFRVKSWQRKEMYDILKEVAETAFRYYTQ
ncbi:EcoRI family type II restriction endonuclease [Mulberry dwarf phytoplasma]|uniref:EcoRI family type II restriction endonuclease n=1 Tax=Mulberry dwarf phytoplasma TaxID=186171 RepID=UPI001D12941D|nr:EcoRI family type II restriction endonuclease [Mulberry dwarf phytoplasma]